MACLDERVATFLAPLPPRWGSISTLSWLDILLGRANSIAPAVCRKPIFPCPHPCRRHPWTPCLVVSEQVHTPKDSHHALPARVRHSNRKGWRST